MPSVPFIRGVELRRKIRQARSGDVVHLEHGNEYEGPFILDKPISLVGHGGATQLFAKGCPAVVVLAPGVRLEHLGVTDSLDPVAGTCLLVERHANAALVDVQTEGHVATVSRDQVVDLGDLLPQQQGLSFLEVEVAGPSTVVCGESSSRWLWAGVGEGFDKTLPAAGKHLLRLGCDARTIGAGGIAVGELRIETGANGKTLWVTVHVLSEQPPGLLTGDIALRSGKSHLIRFADGFLIGRSRLPGLAAASGLPEQQAILLREAGGWALFQPWETPVPTQVNSVALALGQRRLLRDGDQIRVAGLDLKPEAFRGPGNFSVATPFVDLGVVNGQPSRAGFRLSYHGSGKEKLTFQTNVPWLQVSPAAIEIKKSETQDVQVAWTPAVASLRPAKYRERGAILVLGKNETLCLDAGVEIQPEFIAPRASGAFDLRTVVDWEMAGASVKIGNGGNKVWRPSVRVDRDWLTPDASSLIIPPGKEVALGVRLNAKILDLPSPTGDQSAVVRLEGDGAALDVRVTARLQLDLGPDPRLVGPALDFPEVDDWEKAAPLTVLIHNRGRRDWQAVLRAVPWLDVPADLTVPAGKQKSFIVRLNGKLPAGAHDVKDAILLQGDGKALAVGVRACLRLVPKIQCSIHSRHRIDFGEVADAAPPVRITLSNGGGKDGAVSVRTDALPPWLDVQPRTLSVPRNGSGELEVRLTGELVRLPAGLHRAALVLTGEGVGCPPMDVSVAVPSHELEIEPRELLLSVEEGGDLLSLRRELRVVNRGSRRWSGRIGAVVPWLEVEPQQAGIGAGQSLDVSVRATEAVRSLGSGEHVFGRVLLLEGLPLAVGARVRISRRPVDRQSVPPRFEPSVLDFGRVDGVSPKPACRLRIEAESDWQAAVTSQDDWLAASRSGLSGRAGETVELEIGLTERAVALAEGVHWGEVQVEMLGREHPVPVRIERVKPAPVEEPSASSLAWEVDAPYVSLGSVRRDLWDGFLPDPPGIAVRNLGPRALDLSVRVEEGSDAFTVPERFRLPAGPGTERLLPVGLRPGMGPRLRLGSVEGVIVLEQGGGRREVRVALQLLPAQTPAPASLFAPARPAPPAAPPPPVSPASPGAFPFAAAGPGRSTGEEIEIEPLSLDFGTVSRRGGGPPQTVTIRNRGPLPVTVAVESRADWIVVSPPDRMDCPAAASRTLEVSLKFGLFQPNGQLFDPQALVLGIAGRRYRLAVRVETV